MDSELYHTIHIQRQAKAETITIPETPPKHPSVEYQLQNSMTVFLQKMKDEIKLSKNETQSSELPSKSGEN